MSQAPKDDPGAAEAGEGQGTGRSGGRRRGMRQPPRLSVGNGYSLFVGTLKVLLPAILAAMALLILAWPQIVPDDASFRMGLMDFGPEDAEHLTMVNPRYQGRDDRNRPFTVDAREAMQARSDPDSVTLDRPQAEITLADDGWLALDAVDGQYQREAQHLRLTGNVSLFHDHGFEMQTEAADVDLKAGRAESFTAVSGRGPEGTIAAEGFRVEDKGERIFFTGKSRLVFYPEAARGAGDSEGEQ